MTASDRWAPAAGEAAARVQPRKSLGQHFLHDARVLAQIAALCRPEPGSAVIEIGPGEGALTAHLLALGAPVWAIERDDRLPALLAARFGDALTLIHADATAIDWPTLLRTPGVGPAPVVGGNLPYNVGTAIVMALLVATGPEAHRPGAPPPPAVGRVVAMLQREVAERMAAPSPAHPAWGLLSVHTAWRAQVRVALRVGRGAFRPPPKVESAVVVLQPRSEPPWPVPDLGRFDRLVNAGFAMRRKQLAVALGHGLGLARPRVQQALVTQGIAADVRAERLDLAQWAALATALDADLLAQGDRQR